MHRKRVLFLYIDYNREQLIIDRIGNELIERGYIVNHLYVHDDLILLKALRIRPNIIVAPPVLNDNLVTIYSALKLIMRAIIIAFTTEGYMDYRNKDIIRQETGYYQYPAGLIDYVFFWGPLARKMLGPELYRQNKICFDHQIQCFGYPLYEIEVIKNIALDESDANWGHNRNKVLVISGFQGSEYTQRDIVNAQDLFDINLLGEDRKKKIEQRLNQLNDLRTYREKYIDLIVELAMRNKDVDFIVKPHPLELSLPHKQVLYLDRLLEVDNIYVPKMNFPVSYFLRFCKMVIHYGSTINMESYIYKVPTVKIKGLEICMFGFSTYIIDNFDIDMLCIYIDKIRHGEELFKRDKDVERELYEYVNYKVGAPYHPSRDISEFIDKKITFHSASISKELRNRVIEELKREVLKREWEI